MNITEQKINSIPIEVLKPKEEFSRDSVKGYDWFHIPYNNTYIIAKKASGKTNLIYNIIKNTIDKRTKVLIFGSTVNVDPTYREIIKYLEDKEIDVKTYTDLSEGKFNILQTFLNKIKKDNEKDKVDEKTNRPKREEIKFKYDEKAPRPKRIKKKKIVPDYLIVMDDMSVQLRSQVLGLLVRTNRHNKIRTIISYHAGPDMLPASTSQGDYVILFGGYPEDKLEKLYDLLKLSITYPQFQELYKHATKDKYNFLYIDVRQNKYRRNFDQELLF